MVMHGYGRYQILGTYWCSLCGAIHHQQPASEESIMKTAWTTVDGKHYNIGFCNGLHANPDAPKYLAKRTLLPPAPPVSPSEAQIIPIGEYLR